MVKRNKKEKNATHIFNENILNGKKKTLRK
jgi:hypothetical protein